MRAYLKLSGGYLLQKKIIGSALNGLKNEAEKKFKNAVSVLATARPPSTQQTVDVTLPAFGPAIGSLHPLTIVQNKTIAVFQRIGFNLADGPEIVGNWHNFIALNFPENHPARDMQDTFLVQRNPVVAHPYHFSTDFNMCSPTPSYSIYCRGTCI